MWNNGSPMHKFAGWRPAQFYSMDSFQTANNPVRTQASARQHNSWMESMHSLQYWGLLLLIQKQVFHNFLYPRAFFVCLLAHFALNMVWWICRWCHSEGETVDIDCSKWTLINLFTVGNSVVLNFPLRILCYPTKWHESACMDVLQHLSTFLFII